MPDLDDEDDALGIVDRVHYAKIALPGPISARMPRQLLTTWRSRVLGESLDSRDGPLSVGLVSDGLEFPGRGTLDREPISCHGASAP